MSATELLTFSIGPVHSFIAQARRVADLWTGSDLLSHLVGVAMERVRREAGCELVFPAVDPGRPVPRGLPNRFVCRVPGGRSAELAAAMEREVAREWDGLVESAVRVLARHELAPGPAQRESARPERVFDVAWSWVPEEGGYGAAARAGARRYAAARRFRPFVQSEELGEKCALCGERSALPDGRRHVVRERWEAAAAKTEGTPDERFFRFDQGRLCLVCATKRLRARSREHSAYFEALDRFQPEDGPPYLALVALDGDRLGEVLDWDGERLVDGDVEGFHRELSRALGGFAESLRDEEERSRLDLAALGLGEVQGRKPRLIYAGGEDVLLVCDPRDALSIVSAVRRHYRASLEPVGERIAQADHRRRLTISAAVLFVHGRQPAGLSFRDLEALLDGKAKEESGRDSLALRLAKRGGVPVEVAFRWDEAPGGGGRSWFEALDGLVERLLAGHVSSGKTFDVRREEKVLTGVFHGDEEWEGWLADRLSRNPETAPFAGELAREMVPFFTAGKTAALRIARFLGPELARTGR